MRRRGAQRQPNLHVDRFVVVAADARDQPLVIVPPGDGTCLDHVIVLNDAHLIRILTEYFDYYHCSRPHQSLDGNSPELRETQMPERGRIVSEPVLGGLHHCYRRAA